MSSHHNRDEDGRGPSLICVTRARPKFTIITTISTELPHHTTGLPMRYSTAVSPDQKYGGTFMIGHVSGRLASGWVATMPALATIMVRCATRRSSTKRPVVG